MNKNSIAKPQSIYSKAHDIHQLCHSHTFTAALQPGEIINDPATSLCPVYRRIRRRVEQIAVTGQQILECHGQNIQSMNPFTILRRTIDSGLIFHVQIGHKHLQFRHFLMRNPDHTQTRLIGLRIGMPHPTVHIEFRGNILQRTTDDGAVCIRGLIRLLSHQNQLLHLRRKQ